MQTEFASRQVPVPIEQPCTSIDRTEYQYKTGPKRPGFVILTGKERVMGLEPTTTCLGTRRAFALWQFPVGIGKLGNSPERKLSS
jgi:hypothetical protein